MEETLRMPEPMQIRTEPSSPPPLDIPKPIEPLPVAVADFVKIGNTIYALKKVGEGLKIEEELRAFYEDKLRRLTIQMQQGVATEMITDLDRQVRHMARYRERGQIAIPREFVGKPICYDNAVAEVMEIKPIIYHPWLVLGTMGNFRDYGLNVESDAWRGFRDSDEVEVRIKCDVYIPTFVAISRTCQQVRMIGMMTPHTMSGGELCIGNSPFEHYANLGTMALAKQISVINLFSPARSDIQYEGMSIPIRTLITSVAQVVSVAKGGTTQWTT